MINENFKDLNIDDLRKKAGCRAIVLPKETKLAVYMGRLMEQKTAGGIILSEKNIHEESYKKTRGLVIDIAHASKEDESNCNVKQGDIVCFRPFEGIHKPGADDTYGFRLLASHEIHSIEI
tara:strand:- start:1344 stop:1706 length:363 start_codon:yes stop_codon:yes gene_type:complete